MATTLTFFKSTYANFTVCETPKRNPDYVSDSGSKYWYVENSVVRQSDHWGDVASCYWDINSPETEKEITGFCSLYNFKSIEEVVDFKGEKEFDLVFAVLPSFRGYKKKLLRNVKFEQIGGFLYCEKLDICCEYLYACK
jgi:hypothetical protein